MTHRHVETITFGSSLVVCARARTHTHMHAHILTWARAPWGYAPFKRWLGGGRGVFAFVTHFSRGALELPWAGGGVELGGGAGGCSFLCFTSGFLLDFVGIDLTNCTFKLQVCHAMLCSVVVCCGLVRCKLVSCSVVCCGVPQSTVVCDVLWCAVLCGGASVLWSHDVPCGVLCCHVVRSGVMGCGVVSCGGGVSCDRVACLVC